MRAVESSVRVDVVLKEDALGRVERLVDASAAGAARPVAVRRVACGGKVPGSRLVARVLAARERRALLLLRGLDHVPGLLEEGALIGAPALSGSAPRARDVLCRTWIEGVPLHAAERLPRDFFDALERLVRALHARGVCHNDLHKEQNVLVTDGGWPALVDFQLASVHAPDSKRWRRRAREDLRHVHKHLRRYVRDGRGPDALAQRVAATPRARRSVLAWIWRRGAKPVYNALFGRLGWRDREPRRSSAGPWPVWGAPLEPQGRSGPSDSDMRA